jgi:hypothetical protein
MVTVAINDVVAGVTGCTEGLSAENVTAPDVARNIDSALAACGAVMIRTAIRASWSFIGVRPSLYWLEIVKVRGNVNVSASNAELSAIRKLTLAVPALTFVPAAKVISVPAVDPESGCQELLGVTPLPDADAENSNALTLGDTLPAVPAVALDAADCTVIFAFGDPPFGTRIE